MTDYAVASEWQLQMWEIESADDYWKKITCIGGAFAGSTHLTFSSPPPPPSVPIPLPPIPQWLKQKVVVNLGFNLNM